MSKRPAYPIAIEIEYRAFLSKILRSAAKELRFHSKEEIGRLRSYDSTWDETDAIIVAAKLAYDKFIKTLRLRPFLKKLGLKLIFFSEHQVQKTFDENILTKKTDYRDTLNIFIEKNIIQIKSLEDSFFEEGRDVIISGIRENERIESIGKRIAEKAKISEKRGTFIAREQVSNFNADVTRLKQESLGITEYIWRDSRDERVRASHSKRNGEKFKWSDPPAGGHPGVDYGCRCTAEAVINALL